MEVGAGTKQILAVTVQLTPREALPTFHPQETKLYPQD
jgi:hypothetical protein